MADDANPYALAVISAIYNQSTANIEVELYWYNQRLEQFALELPSTVSNDAALARSIASYLVRELQNNGSFSTEKLHTTLLLKGIII